MDAGLDAEPREAEAGRILADAWSRNRDVFESRLAAVASKFELTPLDRRAIEHLALGLTNDEVADIVGIEPASASEFVAGVLRKIGARDRGSLLSLFFVRVVSST